MLEDPEGRHDGGRAALGRAGRIDGIVWLAVGAMFVHTSLLFGYGELWMTGSPWLWVTAFSMVVTAPLAVGHLIRAMLRRMGLPELQRPRGILAAVLVLVVAFYAASPGHLMSLPVVAAGLRVTGRAELLQAWAGHLLDTPKNRLPWVKPYGRPYLDPPDMPAFLGHPRVTVVGATPSGLRMIDPVTPWYPQERAVEMKYHRIDGPRTIRIGGPGFRAPSETGFAQFSVRDGVSLSSATLPWSLAAR